MFIIKYIEKHISLPEDIINDIRRLKKTQGFNFSSWVAITFKEQFGSETYLNKLKKDYTDKIKEIDLQIQQNDNEKQLLPPFNTLNAKAQQILLELPSKINKRLTIQKLTQTFNRVCKSNLTPEQLKHESDKVILQQQNKTKAL